MASASDSPERTTSQATEELRSAMRAYQAGSPEAFERVYALLSPRLMGFLTSLSRDPSVAEDLLQETFLRIHRARRTYDPSYAVEGWAYAIARHVFLMDRRSRSRRGAWKISELDEAREPKVRAHEEGIIADDELRKGLEQLSPARRSALLLHHLWGWTFAEIGHALGIPDRVARQRSSRGMASLRGSLRGPGGSNGD